MKFKAGSMEWYKALPKPLTPLKAEARGLAILCRKPDWKPKPPRRPGMQQRRFGVSWWYWG